jgi:diketogulonate reductase-like aldo/keto reductase
MKMTSSTTVSPPSPFSEEPVVTLNNGTTIPQLAFGMYQVPANEQGEAIVANAIQAGYRHFDSAAFYQNEHILGRALRNSGLSRQEFYITSKVWNDAVKQGPDAVHDSITQTLQDIGFGTYLDLCFIHWPVPGYFVQAYQALQDEYYNGRIRSLGLSNFDETEYHELMQSSHGITVRPVCNQMEVSPVMYRPDLITFFQARKVLIYAYKPLHRANTAVFHHPVLQQISTTTHKTPAQIMLRWCYQKGLVVACKSSTLDRMQENRNILDFVLSETHMKRLDELTTPEALTKRKEHERMRKTSL